ncbi:RHS repeat domain-containing protein, partial [Pseudomonas endophytica]|uniref:RHS repeat domain-containing protein n=1 Tax=Pseudomonas endophytica TaxID=1563157 RepID=UPI000AC64B6E
AYDNADNLLSITFTDLNGQQQPLSFSYDKNGQLLSDTSATGELQYHYDELGNLETLTLPDQRAINHLYYGSGHLHQINFNGRVICDFERDNLHDAACIHSITLPRFRQKLYKITIWYKFLRRVLSSSEV